MEPGFSQRCRRIWLWETQKAINCWMKIHVNSITVISIRAIYQLAIGYLLECLWGASSAKMPLKRPTSPCINSPQAAAPFFPFQQGCKGFLLSHKKIPFHEILISRDSQKGAMTISNTNPKIQSAQIPGHHSCDNFSPRNWLHFWKFECSVEIFNG